MVGLDFLHFRSHDVSAEPCLYGRSPERPSGESYAGHLRLEALPVVLAVKMNCCVIVHSLSLKECLSRAEDVFSQAAKTCKVRSTFTWSFTLCSSTISAKVQRSLFGLYLTSGITWSSNTGVDVQLFRGLDQTRSHTVT